LYISTIVADFTSKFIRDSGNIQVAHGPRNDFVVGGAKGQLQNIEVYEIYTIYAGSGTEPQPTNDLVHFSLKI